MLFWFVPSYDGATLINRERERESEHSKYTKDMHELMIQPFAQEKRGVCGWVWPGHDSAVPLLGRAISLSLSLGIFFSFFGWQSPSYPEAATNQHQTKSFQELERS